MSIKELNVLSKKGALNLPPWIKFAFQLGAFINDYGLKNKKPQNLILSLPSDHYFSLFIAMGIADKIFAKNKQLRSIRKTILNLSPGSRIIYKDEQSSRKVSVINLEPSPVFANEMILKIKDGKIDRGIPEKQWLERVIILDEEFDEIKRTRKVSKSQLLGLDNNRMLRSLYTASQLSKAAFYPGDAFYLVGNTAKITETMNEKIFLYNGVCGTVSDFLYLDNSNSYTNGKLFSSYMKKNSEEISPEVPVVFSDLFSYIKQAQYFTNNPRIILSSRTDNENRIHEVKEEIRRELFQDDHKIVTEEIVNYFNTTETQIPPGVEFLAWR